MDWIANNWDGIMSIISALGVLFVNRRVTKSQQ